MKKSKTKTIVPKKYCVGKNCQTTHHIINPVILVMGLIAPIASIPQAVQIYASHSAAGVSLLTWVFFAIYNGLMIVYGAVHGLKPIIISNIIWVVLEIFVITGIVMYS